jgi:CBS-domain-containing membrane protein
MNNLLRKTPVTSLRTTSTSMILLKSDDQLLHALRTLMTAGIVSAPVVDEQGHCLGLVDVLDILNHVIEIFEDTENMQITLYERLDSRQKLATLKISDITDFSHNPFTPIRANQSVYDACVVFVNDKSQRCPIVDDQSRIVGMITQADVLQFIANNKFEFGDFAKKTVKELNLGTRPVITVTKQTRTVDAYHTLYKNKISGIGIEDDEGELIGNLSTRDLKYLTTDKIYQLLCDTATHFFQMIRSNEVNETSPAISCSEKSEIGYIIARMAVNRIHRMYICDNHNHAIGIISLRDIIASVINDH